MQAVEITAFGAPEVLRLGAHQLLSMRVPLHAAVGATVDLAACMTALEGLSTNEQSVGDATTELDNAIDALVAWADAAVADTGSDDTGEDSDNTGGSDSGTSQGGSGAQDGSSGGSSDTQGGSTDDQSGSTGSRPAR